MKGFLGAQNDAALLGAAQQLGMHDVSVQLRAYEEQLKQKDARIAELLTVIKILSKELRNA